MKKEKGITLIALVITIIVLLILAGVTIAMLIGENGLLSKALAAKNNTEQSRLEEENKLSKTDEIINKYITNRDGSITVDQNDLKNLIKQTISEEVYKPTIFNGNAVTNTLGSSNSTAKVNTFTVTESGKYVITFDGTLKWNDSSVFGLYIVKQESETIASNMYSNNGNYSLAGINVATIEELNVGDIIDVKIYQYNNGSSGTNNLQSNDLKLIKIGN